MERRKKNTELSGSKERRRWGADRGGGLGNTNWRVGFWKRGLWRRRRRWRRRPRRRYMSVAEASIAKWAHARPIYPPLVRSKGTRRVRRRLWRRHRSRTAARDAVVFPDRVHCDVVWTGRVTVRTNNNSITVIAIVVVIVL